MSEPTEAKELDWANDPDNAKNWSTSKKIYNTAVPALLCMLMYANSTGFRVILLRSDIISQILRPRNLFPFSYQRPT